jgi:hypothetical protein
VRPLIFLPHELLRVWLSVTMSSPPTVLGPIEARVPPEPAEPHAAGVTGALLKYQHQFLSHLNFAKAVLIALDSRTAMSRQCCAEQEMQVQVPCRSVS